MVTSETANRFLAGPALALAGASRSGRKFGNLALKTLISKGYRVYPVHPSASVIDGVECVRRFDEISEPVSCVVVVVPPARALDVVRDAHAAGIARVWLQQGSESSGVLRVCRELGVEVVAGECVLMYAHPTSYHRIHAIISRLFAKRAAA